MDEEKRAIKDYEGVYEVTRSGRIISVKLGRARHRNGDEYGYANVHLYKNGERTLHKTYKLWESAFPDVDEREYKGER
ncbi:NUMOD4 domain-containing protein [Paenibacillus durus]|uniref:3-ketosteroid-delta-1-dehydrogenase n=1 Tax=Paenibacillus durus TaxID=44251 RepID=A0A089HRC8_PAEDU|nr:NUMOD4 domain-containing protein [Paenibacillus durus]AIQ13652.1 3-ketosteroid-delta-1-dehydrogenase [Paenibacillus durus]